MKFRKHEQIGVLENRQAPRDGHCSYQGYGNAPLAFYRKSKRIHTCSMLVITVNSYSLPRTNFLDHWLQEGRLRRF